MTFSSDFKNIIWDKIIEVVTPVTLLSEPLLCQEGQMAKSKMIRESMEWGGGVPAQWDLLASSLSSMLTHDSFRNLYP